MIDVSLRQLNRSIVILFIMTMIFYLLISAFVGFFICYLKRKRTKYLTPSTSINISNENIFEVLILKLNRDKLQIEKHHEAIELEKTVILFKNNPEKLFILKKDVDRLCDFSVKDLANYHFENAEIDNKKNDSFNSLINYIKAIQLDKNPMYFNNRGCLYHQMDSIELAIDDYSKAIMLSPNNGKYYYNRAGAYYAINRNDEARRDWQKAFDMGISEAENPLRFYF